MITQWFIVSSIHAVTRPAVRLFSAVFHKLQIGSGHILLEHIIQSSRKKQQTNSNLLVTVQEHPFNNYQCNHLYRLRKLLMAIDLSMRHNFPHTRPDRPAMSRLWTAGRR